MGSQPQVQTIEIINDNEKTDQDQWNSLGSTYTRTNKLEFYLELQPVECKILLNRYSNLIEFQAFV